MRSNGRMRRFLALIVPVAVAVIISFAGLGEAVVCEIVVVQSSEIRPFQQAFEGFEEASGCSTKEVILVQPGSSDLSARVRRSKPDGVLALGLDALSKLQNIKDIPIFYTMATNLPRNMQSADNISGVSMIIAPELQLASIRQLLPQARRVGIIYDPSTFAYFVERLQKAGRASSIEVVARKTHSPQEVVQQLNELKGRVDVLLMLPDLTVVTPETVEAMMLFSFRNAVPVISFSEKYVNMGALASIMMVPADLGTQTGGIARDYFSNIAGRKQVKAYARKNLMIINKKIAEKLRIQISDEVLRKSLKVE